MPTTSTASYLRKAGRPSEPETGFTFDAGALIAVEQGTPRMRALLRQVLEDPQLRIAIPAGVVAQVWRGGDGRQTPISRLLKSTKVETVVLDKDMACTVGILCGEVDHPDAVDGSVVVCAKKRRHTIFTTDPNDMRKLDASIPLESPY